MFISRICDLIYFAKKVDEKFAITEKQNNKRRSKTLPTYQIGSTETSKGPLRRFCEGCFC